MKWKVRLLHDRPGWAYWRRCEALKKYAPADFEVTTGLGNGEQIVDEPQDLYLQLCYSKSLQLREECYLAGHKSLIVTGFNTNWKDEGPFEGQYWFPQMTATSDWVIFNCREAWRLAGEPEKTSAIAQAVDLDVFRQTTPPENRTPLVLWIGSTYHSTPENDVKGYILLRELQCRLDRRGISSDFLRVDADRPMLNTEQIVSWYNLGTVFVVASRSEGGGPNPLLEASACGCVPVSTSVGSAPFLVENHTNGILAERTVEDLERYVIEAVTRYRYLNRNMQQTIKAWGWEERAAEYYRLFRRLLSAVGT
jgi:glycosyltransferase involved in cell wall biosynthesis